MGGGWELYKRTRGYPFHLTLPYLTLPYLTLPYLTLPYLTLLYFTLLTYLPVREPALHTK